jgi:hypothetical protein
MQIGKLRIGCKVNRAAIQRVAQSRSALAIVIEKTRFGRPDFCVRRDYA